MVVPTPTAGPQTAAIRGLGKVARPRKKRNTGASGVLAPRFKKSLMSLPALKIVAWPWITTTCTLASAAACLFYAVATHPAEALAAICWFAGVSGLAAATRRPIDAILAHAATNLALGVYVLATGNWWLM